MKHTRTAIFVLLLTTGAFAQGDSELRLFKGGRYAVDFSLSNTLFMGVGSRVGGMGGDYGGMIRSSESLLWNPANLALIERTQLSLDFTPRLMLDPASFIDIDAEIRSNVDKNIEDIKGPDFTMTDDDYPDLGIKAGEKGSLGSGTFTFRGQGFVVAAAIYQPVALSLDVLGTGFETQMTTLDKDDPTKDVTIYASLDLNAFAKIKTQSTAMGIARQLSSRWSAGLAIERLSGMAETGGRIQIEGIMLIAGNERAFNDPNDPWQNTLHSTMHGRYEGATTIFRTGARYKLGKNWGIGLAFSSAGTLKMAGSITTVQHTLEGLHFDAKDDEDFLDATEIDLDEPTKTILKESPTANVFEMSFPGSVGLGLSGKFSFLGISLNYVRHYGELSYRYNLIKTESESKNYQALKMDNALRLGLDLKVLRIGVGIATATLVDDAEDASAGESTFVPTFSLATGFRISRNLSTDLLILGVPSGVGKITINYEL